jgi:SAM-dependent methyltransferase
MPEDYTDATYGDRIADIYDVRYLEPLAEDTVDAVSFLKDLAGDGPALELGIGTGRVAIPLAETGVEVHGLDTSEAMVARLRSKPGGDRLRVAIGSFADFDLETRFPLVYVVFNTFFSLLTQDEQVSAFQSVARHLAPGGAFAMQAFVPDVTRFENDQHRVAVESVGIDEITLEMSSHDAVTQRTDSQYVLLRQGDVRLFPVRIRYAYVSELDLMARLAGLRLRERWSSWRRERFPSPDRSHISVWEPAGTS